MPATGSNPPASLSDHMSDDLFDYDVEIPDIVIPTNAPAPPPNSEKKDSLGIDEEVKIKKKRVGVKLDEARLMSDLGIPKLRQDAPKKIKFRGKGHEYRDAARLLSYYQFWADDLYKKAKFRDTLKIIEKLGHSRSMRDQRLSWIEETKRKEKLSRAGDNDAGADVTGEKEEPQKDDGVFEDDQNDDDLYSFPQQLTTRIIAQSSATGEAHASSPRPLFLSGGLDDSDDDDFGVGLNDDELDTLMDIERAVVSAGASTKPPAEPEKIAGMNATTAISTAPPEDDFEDEIEAMADFGPPPEW